MTAPVTEPVTEIAHGAWRLGVRPDLGGVIARLSHGGVDVLRPTPEGATDVLQAACFPLLPYANRIAGGRFVLAGQTIAPGPTPGFEPHALHGFGWRRPWRLSRDGDALVMSLVGPAGPDWPWATEGRQSLSLDDDGLSVALSLTNRDDRPMPAGLGLHPYFPRPPEARLTLSAARVWTVDGTLIPLQAVAPAEVMDWSDGPPIAQAPFVDHAYAGWDGRAVLTTAAGVTTLTAPEPAGLAHVFTPQGETYVCVEPVTHRPDAHNAPQGEATGLRTLAPGQTLAMTMRIGFQPA